MEKAEALRQSILRKAFSEKLVAQDPNDEPASILLERLRIERAEKEKGKSSPSAVIDSAHKGDYEKGAASFVDSLKPLDAKIAEMRKKYAGSPR